MRKYAIEYLIFLIKKHGYNILRNTKNRILITINSIVIDIKLASNSILYNWLSKFKKMGIML